MTTGTFKSYLLGIPPKRLLQASVVVAVVTITLKLIAWHVTDSVGLLSDAMESFVNLASAIFALAMVTIAGMPADANHPFGHSKAEYFSSGFEGILIFGAALLIMWAATVRLLNPAPLDNLGWGLLLSVLSAALNGALAMAMLVVARAQKSVALEGDAHHLLTDVWTTAGVVAGVAAVGLTGWQWLDPVIAMVVALNIVYVGAKLVWAAAQGLMDKALDPQEQVAVDAILEGLRTPEVYFDHMRSRQAGQLRFVDLHMHVPADWSLGYAAQRRQHVMQCLTDAVTGLRVTIELLPCEKS